MRTTGLHELDSGSWSLCVMAKIMWQNPDHSKADEQESRVVETNSGEGGCRWDGEGMKTMR